MGMYYESDADEFKRRAEESANLPAESWSPAPGFLKRSGLAVARGGIMAERAANIAAGGVVDIAEGIFSFPKVHGEPDTHWSDFFYNRAGRWGDTIKDYTPDPDSVGAAQKFLEGILEIPGQLVGGPNAFAVSAALNTGADLGEAGVDPGTATVAGIGAGTVAKIMTLIPAAGGSLKQTAGLVAANPVVGAAQRQATKSYLESQGYDEQAAMFDPLDPQALGTDTALGLIFGAFGYRSQRLARALNADLLKQGDALTARVRENALAVREALPVEIEDSLDTMAQYRKMLESNPFDATTRDAVERHISALNTALDSIQTGKPVDITDHLTGFEQGPSPLSYTAQMLRDDLKMMYGSFDDELDGVLAVMSARAKVQGKDLDTWINDNIAGVRLGMGEAAAGVLWQDHVKDVGGVKVIDMPAENRIERGVKIASTLPVIDVPDLFDTAKISLEDARRQGIEYYQQTLAANPVKGLAFGGESVGFTDRGLNHLLGGDRAQDIPEADKVRRLKLLPKVKAILEQTPFVDEVRTTDQGKEYGLLGRFADGRVVRVVVEEREQGGKVFYTVYDWKDVTKKMKRVPLPDSTPDMAGYREGKAPSDRDDNTLYQSRPLVKPFYSKLLAEVETLKQEKWSAPDLLNKLRKTHGVKGDEIAWTGLDEFLAGRKSVTREEVRKFLDENQVRVEEVVKGEDARYAKHTLPGGEGYREVLFTLPAGDFSSRHWQEKNVLAHARFNERTGPNGERVLHIEEVQKEGDGEDGSKAPFANTWHELPLRRMLRWAAEHGFDRVSWTTGEQQAYRNDISSRVDAVRYSRAGDVYTVSLIRDGGEIARYEIGSAVLDDAVSKKVARKIRDNVGRDIEGGKELAGDDLKTTGDWIKGIYDRIIPQFMEKFGRKFGAKVQDMELPEAGRVHSIDITDSMRNSLLYEGQPLFQGEKGAVSFLADGRAVIHALEAPDFSTLVHELAHVFERGLTADERKAFAPLFDKAPDVWQREHSETFARAFERYLAEGKAPTKELAGVFETFKTWMLEIYRRITGTAIDVKMTDDVRRAFDSLFVHDAMTKGPTPEVGAVRADIHRQYQDVEADLHEMASGIRLSHRRTLEAIRAEVAAGEAGSRVPALDEQGNMVKGDRGYEYVGSPSTFPEYFQNKGYGKKETLAAIDRALAGKPLGVRQQVIVEDLFAAKRREELESTMAYRQTPERHDEILTKSGGEQMQAADLKEGDTFTRLGEEYRVLNIEGDINPTVTIKDGHVMTLRGDEPVLLDRGSLNHDGGHAADEGFDFPTPTGENSPLTHAVDSILQRGDFQLYEGKGPDGQDVFRSAREVLDEARADLAATRERRSLYHEAAACLRMGG